jgi:hypothetical protein
MDEKYIQDLYNQLGGQSKFGNFNDFKNLIKTDKQYQKDFYNSFGAKKLGEFNDFSGLVSASNQKKKGSSQPTSQEDQSVSSAQQKERLISAVTGQQQNQQASATSDGEPKIGTFTGFTPEQQKSMKEKPAPDYMVKKPREKEIEKQTEVSKGELLIQSTPFNPENNKSYYRVVADKKRDVEDQIMKFEDKYLKAGIDIEQIKTDGTYQDLQKQKAQLDEEYRPVENALREVKKETTTFTRPIERLVSSFTDGKYTLANTETINLSKDVENKLIDSFDKLPQEQKQKWAKGSLPTEAKEQLINSAKTDVLNEKYASLKAEVIDYIKNVKDNPNIPTEQKKIIQDQLKAKNDAFNAQLAVDFSGNMLKNNFKSTKQSKDLDEGILSKYEGFLPATADLLSTFIEGMGSVIAKGVTGIPTLALLGAERFNQITGASNPEDYTPIEATLDLINDTTNYNFLPSSKSADGNIVDEKGNLNLSAYSLGKTLVNVLPFTLKVINDVKNGRIDGSPQSMISQLLNPKNNKQFRDKLISAETAYKITIGDNYKQAKDLGMTDANAFTYANVMSTAEGVSESIMPDIKFFDTVAGSSIKEAFKGNLKNAATKEAAKTVTKDFFQNIAGELGEEEFTLAVEDGLKYSLLLNHKNSEFFNLTKQKELAASTIILSSTLGGVAIPKKLKESKKDIYRSVYNNIADIQDIFAAEIKSPLTDRKTKETLYEAYKFASDVANAVAKAPETVTADQIDLLVQKNKLEEKKKNIDTAFHPDINKEIADIDAKIAEASKVKVEPVAEVKPTDTKQPVVTAETSSNFANMTQDGEGNFVFYHVSPTTLDVIDPSKYGSNAGNVTSRDEKAAIGRVGGVAMFYTDPTDSENMVNGNKHVVKVPESEVYDFNSDPENFIDEAKRQFSEANPNMAFSPNDQFAWITKVAGDNGYKMVVGEWGKGKTRAQTTQKLTPVDVMELNGNVVTKPFEKEYVGNREKGFKSVVPQSKQSKIKEAKAAIDSFRSRAGKYDELYQAVSGSRPNMTDEEIKKLVDESDIPQELKDQYNEAMAYEPGNRRTEAPAAAYERTDDVSLDNAPEGTFLNIGLNIGTTQDLMDKDDVISMLPEGVEVLDQGVNEAISEIDGKENKELTLSVKLSRPLTDVEMAKFLVDTKQKAIPQMSESKGAMHGTKEWGDFNPEYFYMPDGSKLSDTASLTKNVDAELEALNKLFDESEQGGKVTDEQIENGKKAIENLVPDVEWVIHETNESMREATGDINKGEYIMTTDKDGNVKKVIHINKAAADGTTVAHEVFHAVLLDKVLNDADAQDLTRRMMKAVAKTASPELKRELDDFARNYEENIRDEEKLAQLIGILAKNYDQLSQPNKTIIKKWLDKLAKMFGLKPFTDNEVIDLLNTIAGKTAKGEAITEKDVAMFNEEGAGGFAGVFKISRQQKGIEAPKVKDDPRSFIRDVVEDVDIREFNGKKFITNMYDYTNAGETDLGNGFKIDLFGGKGYVPYMMELNNKKIGDVSNLAAFNTQAQAETFIRNAEKSGAELFAPHSGSKKDSWQFQQHTFAELVNLVLDKGILTNKELIDSFNKTIKGNKAVQKEFSKFSDRYGEKIKDFSSFISDPKKIVDLLDIKNNLSPDLRKALNNNIASNKKFQEAIGISNVESFYNKIMDPLNSGITGGEIMGVVKFDPNTFKIVETKPDAIDHHPSFGYTLLAKINGIYQPTEFYKSYDVTESYTKYNLNETKVSIKSEDIKFNEKNVTSSAGAIPKVAKFEVRRSQKSGEGVKFEARNNSEYVVKDNGEVVGRLKLTNNRDLGKGYLEVDTAELLADYIGKGIGSDLYRAAAKNLNNEDIVITSSKFRSEKAESMWKKLEKAGEAVKIYSDNKLKRSVYALVNPREVRRSQKVSEVKLTDDKYVHPGFDAALEAAGETEESIKDWEKKNAVKQQQKRTPKVQDAAEKYFNEEISQDELLDIVKKEMPIKSFTKVPAIPTFKDLIGALDKDKVAKGIVGLTKKIADGVRIASRLDIPAYERFDTWVVSVHDGIKDGLAIAYGQTAVLKNVDFSSFPGIALNIARGKVTSKGTVTAKTPMARIFGDWVNEDPQSVHDRAVKLMSDSEWIQVGMNPFRHSWFYDKADGMPIKSADEVIQVGALVLAKNAVKVSPSDPMFETKSSKGNVIRFQTNAGKSIGDYVRIAKANNFSDDAIKKFLKAKGFSDTDIDAAMSARITVSDRPSARKINEDSKKAIEDRRKKMSIKDLGPFLRKSILDRQAYIKRVINRIDNKSAKKAYDLLVTKAGASALASERFKRAEKKIYGGLSSDEITILDEMIYASRMIAINENRAKLGMEPYTGKKGYSINEARQDLEEYKILVGDKKFNDLSNRVTAYFDVFKTNLKKLYDSGRINKEAYDELSNTEYSPIKTIKYIIGDNLTTEEIDTQAKTLGIARKDIMKLSDSNEDDIIMDSKWLLAMTVSSVEGRAFENNMLREFDRAINAATPEEKKAFEEFVLENPVVGKKADGGLKYKYDDTKPPPGFVKVSYFNDGNKVDIIIKAEYAKQLLDVKDKNKALETLGALTGTKILRFFATGGNPLFIIGNTAVDFQNIAFFSNVYSKFKPMATVQLARDYVKNFVKKLVVSKEYNKIFNEYINHGGALDYMASDGLRALESMNPIKGVTKAAQRGLIAYGRAMAFLGETSEVAFRLSVFEKVKNDSIKEFEKENNRKPNAQELDDIMWNAARESRETMDFSQGGDVAKNIDVVFPYFNAALQGIRRPIDFAKKDPVGFSASVLQYTVMASGLAAGSFAMLIKAVRDDEDDDKKANKKIMDALNSLSEYEKANYHIIFTGNKNKDGEYEYYRVKKLPGLSVISTVAEQLIYKQFFNSQGVDYDVDSEAMLEAVSKSNPLPITVQEVAAKNPVASGLVSYWANKDTFTGDKIFREPNNKKISPEAEGMFDDRVDQIYKDLAPGFGLSPARTKVMVEKVITSANTNPTIPLMYSAYDGLFNNNDGLGAEVQDAMSNVGDAFGKKLVRHTDKNVMRYKEQDKMELQETVIETDVWKNEQKVYNEIKNRYKDGDKMTNKELFDIVEKNFEPIDRIKYIKKYNAYIHNMNVDKSVLDIIFEDVPEVQAMKLNQRYGSDLGEDEIKELTKASASAGKRVSNKSIYIYNKKYKNRKD